MALKTLLSQAQKTTLNTWLTNNASGLTDKQAATALNALFSPSYFVWRTSVSRAEIYNTISDVPSSWDWSKYVSQSVTEQGAWVQMFMGDQADFSKVNLRGGIGKIFTSASSANRDHAFAIGRRATTDFEQLYVVAVTSPQANSGNDGIAGNRGKTTNPDLLGVGNDGVSIIQGTVTEQDVSDIRGGL